MSVVSCVDTQAVERYFSMPTPHVRHLVPMHIVLEPCTPDDSDFAFHVTEEAMRKYVEQAFGAWDVHVQRRLSEESFDPTTYRVIVVDLVRAGILVVEDRPSEMFLSKIFLLPRFQRQGIGSALIRELIESAGIKRKALRLRVLRVNPARVLYERLGFRVTNSTPDHDYMEYLPRREARERLMIAGLQSR